jgi:hypothetical protein
MAKEVKKDNLLSSWKAIAAYLDCDVRTCMRWEKKYGLPINRIDGLAKATVFAYRDELDEWLSKFSDSPPLGRKSARRKIGGLQIFYIAAAVFAVLAIRFLLLPRIQSHPVPSNFQVEKGELLILNDEWDELWRYDTGVENLVSEREYREHFQFKRISDGQRLLPHLMIKDLNMDGGAEVLFSIQTQDEADEGRLFCFDHRGRALWEFQAGRQMRFGERVYSSDYRIRGFDVCDLEGDGNFEIVVASIHRFFFPTQLVVLDAEGSVLGEYWNAGHLGDIAFIDLDEDGEKEILAAGLNNEYGKGCLVAFDWDRVKGASPQGSDFKCQGWAEGSERNYILFPRTDVDLLEHHVEAIDLITPLHNRQISVKTHLSAIYYIFDYELELQDVRLSHTFKHKHKLAVLEGKVNSELNKDYERNLEKGLLYR